MKKSIFTFAILSIFTIIIGIPSLQAQEAETVAAAYPSKNLASLYDSTRSIQQADNRKKSYALNMAAGQHAPHFEGMNTYLITHLAYPQEAKENAIEGTVKVLAVISPEGMVVDASIIESIGFGCDEAALDVVQKMPTWTPAMNYGIPVKGKKLLEINFRLQ